jgi:hypothetical protein
MSNPFLSVTSMELASVMTWFVGMVILRDLVASDS